MKGDTTDADTRHSRDRWAPLCVNVGKKRSFHQGNLLRDKPGKKFAVAADLVEADLIRGGGRGAKPRVSDDADFAPRQGEFGNVVCNANVIIHARVSHKQFSVWDAAGADNDFPPFTPVKIYLTS